MAGLAVLLAGMGLCGYWSVCLLRRNLSNRMLLCLLAILPALVVSAVHSAFDYVWYVPGCMVLVVMLAACLCRLWHLERERAGAPTKSMAISRYGWLGMTACLGVVGFFLFQDSVSGALAEPDWHRYLRVRQEAWHLEGAEQREAYESMLEALNATVAKKPDFARAHSRLAAAHLALFDLPEDPSVNPLSLAHIRQAAEASRFDSSEALNTWLARAVGSRLEHLNAARKHARRAVALGPLQGEAYLYLAELAFLDGPHFPSRAAYVDQAARVRPFDGDVLFEQGREALFAGRPDEAMHFWKEAFRAGRIHQKHMVRMLAERLPAAVFLEVFEHDLFTLRLLESRYRGLERPDETALVTRRLAQQAEEEALADESETAAQHWLQAALAYQRLHESEEAIRCLRRAVGCDAYNYDLRYRLGACLCENQRYEEAEEHLNWCLQRKPDNGKLKALMAEAVDGRLRRAPRQHGD